MKRNLCALGSRNMGSEQGKGLRVGEHAGAALWGRKAARSPPHLYTVGSYSGALSLCCGQCQALLARMELGERTQNSRQLPELHTAA